MNFNTLKHGARKRFRIPRRFNRLFFWGAIILVVIILAGNSLATLLYLKERRAELVYKPEVKMLLPLYREMRRVAVAGVNLFFLPDMVGGDIETFELSIDRNDLSFLNNNLPDSRSNDVLAGVMGLPDKYKKEVPARLTIAGEEYDVDVRYHGAGSPHWSRPKKSWRIDFKDEPPFGAEVVKLIIPSDREYFAEELNNYRARKLGLIVPYTDFVRLTVNGRSHGVYYLIEDWSAEMLERNGRPSDAPIYGVDDEYHLAHCAGKPAEGECSIWSSVWHWDRKTKDKTLPYDDMGDIEFLNNLLARDDFSNVAEDMVDLDSFYAWQIVMILSGSDHQSDGANVVVYRNTSSGKFEFIHWDNSIGGAPIGRIAEATTVARRLLAIEPIRQEFYTRLWNYVDNKENLKDDLAYYDIMVENYAPALFRDFRKHDSNRTLKREIVEMRDAFIGLVDSTRSALKAHESRAAIVYDASYGFTIDLFIDLISGMRLTSMTVPPVAAVADLYRDSNKSGIHDAGDAYLGTLLSDNDTLSLSGLDVPLYEGEHRLFVRLRPGIKGDPGPLMERASFSFTNAVTGEEEKIKRRNMRYADTSTFRFVDKITATPREFTLRHLAFFVSGDVIALPAGTHIFSGVTIVPKGTLLRIMPGATLLFKSGASLVSYSPVEARGSAFQPIRFLPAGDAPWGSVAIVNTGKESVFSYAHLRGGSGASVNGIITTGMLSVFHGDLVLEDSRIEDARDDDGVNVKYGSAHIAHTVFEGNSADALDLDFATGIVERSTFLDNGNDGIDISGSTVLLAHNVIRRSGDKCISIGERSEGPIVFNSLLEACAIGIETKDGSTPRIINVEIKNNGIGLNAYRKKPLFVEGGLPSVYNTVLFGNTDDTADDKYSKTTTYVISDLPSSKGGDASILADLLSLTVPEAPVGLLDSNKLPAPR